MRIRLVLLILIAFGAALGTVWFARNWMEAQRAAMTQAPPAPLSHDEILVAKANGNYSIFRPAAAREPGARLER